MLTGRSALSATGLFGLLTVAAFARYATPQQLTVEFDPQQTNIEWTLGDVLHTVHGTFQMKQGRVTFDPGTQAVSGDIVIDMSSGASGSGARDRRMKKDVLETQRYPEARFVPTKIDGAIALKGPSTARVTGTLEIHGSKHEVTIPMRVDISGTEVKANGSFVIPYVAWGMKNPSTFILRVDQTVKVEVHAVGHLVALNTE
jgi:polyisoprenoid-binding protein YceI